MRMHLYDANAGKRPVNVTLNSDLIARARAAGINISAVAEEAVAESLRRIARERFDADIAQACRAHDRYLEEYGCFSELLRAHADNAE